MVFWGVLKNALWRPGSPGPSQKNTKWIHNAQKIALFRPYKVTEELFELADPTAVFMHCMPVHYGEEVDSEIAHGPHSVMIDQAENRLYAQQAILTFLLGA